MSGIQSVPSAASAHGPNPEAQEILFDVDDPTFVYVASTAFGHFVSHDSGATYGWLCPDLFAAAAAGSFPIDGVVLAGSAVRTIACSASSLKYSPVMMGCRFLFLAGILFLRL